MIFELRRIIVEIWTGEEVLQQWKDSTINMLDKKKDEAEYGDHRGLAFVATQRARCSKIKPPVVGVTMTRGRYTPQKIGRLSSPTFDYRHRVLGLQIVGASKRR